MPKTSGSARKKAKRTSGQRAGVTKALVLETAARLADVEGLSSVTLARLASELDVKTPSLYSHVRSLDEVHQQLKGQGLTLLVDRMRRAAVGRAGFDAVRAIADAQRAFAREHPGLYAATARVTAEDEPEVQAVGGEMLEVVLSALSGYGLEGDDALHATRCLRAATRGFCDLELAGGFGMPLEVDESWTRLLAMLDHGLREPAARSRISRAESDRAIPPRQN